MVRIARGHGLKPSVFYRCAWSGEPFSLAEVDESHDHGLFLWLSRKTATPLERVVECALPLYATGATSLPRPNSRESSQCLLRHGRPPQEKVLRFCPRCLGEDSVPYFRRRWRLAFVRACEKHRARLLRGCLGCRAMVRFDWVPLKTPSLATCHRCRLDLRQAVAAPLPSTGEVEMILQLQERLLAVGNQSARYRPELSLGRA